MNVYSPDDADGYSKLTSEASTYQFGLKLLAETVQGLKTRGTYLDFGCGTGRTSELLTEVIPYGSNVYGIDANPEMIKIAKEKDSNRHVKYILGNEQIPFGSETFDVITCANVLDEISSFSELFDLFTSWHRVLRGEGHLLISSGNPQAKLNSANFKNYRYKNMHGISLSDGMKVECIVKDKQNSEIKIIDTYWSNGTIITLLQTVGFEVHLHYPKMSLSTGEDSMWGDEVNYPPDVMFHCRKKVPKEEL